jgi:hypothetical protein
MPTAHPIAIDRLAIDRRPMRGAPERGPCCTRDVFIDEFPFVMTIRLRSTCADF